MRPLARPQRQQWLPKQCLRNGYPISVLNLGASDAKVDYNANGLRKPKEKDEEHRHELGLAFSPSPPSPLNGRGGLLTLSKDRF